MIGVSYILTNEKYTGNTLLQKTYSTNTLPVRRFKNNGNADQYYVRNTHPAIIQQETFDKVQRLISEKIKSSLEVRHTIQPYTNISSAEVAAQYL